MGLFRRRLSTAVDLGLARCTRCHGTGRVLMSNWGLGGTVRTHEYPCPYHN